MIGKTISHYKITAKLGAGGMGEVYQATDMKLERQVALKFLPESLQRDLEARERLLREARAASKLNHPNILTIHSVEEADGRDFIVMEFVGGESLAETIDAGKQSVGKAIDVGVQICDSLEKAHQEGIVHRDLKPGNILIDEDGRAKLCDFGLAILRETGGGRDDNGILGTAHYISPEQVNGVDVDHRSDIWSLGVVLYEMLAGRPPFPGDYDQAILYAVTSEDPLPLNELRDDIPPRLSEAVNKALSKDPTGRFQNAQELRAELQAIGRELESPTPAHVDVKTERLPSIAVLPFSNMSADPENEYFSDGLAEELINALTKLRSLRVAARTSSFSFKNKDIDVPEIGRKLNVEAILEGSVRKAGNRLRITAQLVNVADGYHLWSERYDREMDDIFAIQDEISLIIVDRLRGTLLKDEKAALVKRDTDDPEAYNDYLKGLYHLNRRTREGFEKSLEHFRRAVERDPEYAKAHAGLAMSYALGATPAYDLAPPRELHRKAEHHAQIALSIDAELPEALNALAMINLDFKWDWDTAAALLEKSLAINPNLADTHHYHAEYLTIMGRIEEAIAAEKRARELDPLSLVITSNVGRRYYYARRFEEAILEARRALEMDPHFFVANIILAWYLRSLGRHEEALDVCLKIPAGSSRPAILLFVLGITYAGMGRKDETAAILDELRDEATRRYIPPTILAAIYMESGEIDTAFEWLEKAYKERDAYLISLKVDPINDPLRDDPRYHALVKKLGLDQ